MSRLKVNGRSYSVNAAPDTPLLWVLREDLRLTGTKFACGQWTLWMLQSAPER